jgi:hypothetical protein
MENTNHDTPLFFAAARGDVTNLTAMINALKEARKNNPSELVNVLEKLKTKLDAQNKPIANQEVLQAVERELTEAQDKADENLLP